MKPGISGLFRIAVCAEDRFGLEILSFARGPEPQDNLTLELTGRYLFYTLRFNEDNGDIDLFVELLDGVDPPKWILHGGSAENDLRIMLHVISGLELFGIKSLEMPIVLDEGRPPNAFIICL
jgi:hypothetical protein